MCLYGKRISRADSRFASSQWETSLQSNDVSHWLGANLFSPDKYQHNLRHAWTILNRRLADAPVTTMGVLVLQNIPPKPILYSYLAESCSSETPNSVAQSFWNFTQSREILLPCTVLNFKTIEQRRQAMGKWDFSRFEFQSLGWCPVSKRSPVSVRLDIHNDSVSLAKKYGLAHFRNHLRRVRKHSRI